MKKTTILLVVVLFMIIGYAAFNTTVNIYGVGKLAENLSDFKVYLSNLKVNGKEVSGINNTKDEFTINDVNGDVTVDIVNDSTEYDVESYLECVKEDENVGKVWNYDYTGGEQTFTAPLTGTYKLETWGAQGGSYSTTFIGGNGGYSSGIISLVIGQKLYINVGSQGIELTGGYNGGATVNDGIYGRAGGGATHIATKSGLLSSLENSKSNILIVSGGGGGAAQRGAEYGDGDGGSAGGFVGNDGQSVNHSNGFGYGIGTGGTQTSFGQIVWTMGIYGISEKQLLKSYGAFGLGGGSDFHAAGGGGGYYGGGGSFHGGAGGGSGYVGNSLLTEKSMYCYNCQESNEISTKTISTTCTSTTPKENCAKSGNGFARISLLFSSVNVTTDKVMIAAQESNNQDIKSVVGKSLICKLKLNKLSRTEKASTK